MRGRYAPSFFHLPAGEKMECASPPKGGGAVLDFFPLTHPSPVWLVLCRSPNESA